MGRKKIKRHYPPAVIKYREANPQISISVPRAIKEEIERLVDEINRNIHEKKDKESPSSWCRKVIKNVFNKDFQKKVLGEVIILKLGKKAKAAADKYRKEKMQEADDYCKEITRKANEHHNNVVKFQDDYVRRGYDRGLQEGLEKGEVRGREKTERESERKLREAEEAREEAEAAAKEEGRKEGFEDAKKKYSSMIAKKEKEFSQKVKDQEKKFAKELEEAEKELDVVHNKKYSVLKSHLNQECRNKLAVEYNRGFSAGCAIEDGQFELGYKAGLKEKGRRGIFSRGKK